MTAELKPCPFCGGEARVSTRMDEDIWSHNTVPYTRVACNDCEIGTDYLCEGWEPTAQEAWNRRATDGVTVAAPTGYRLVPIEPTKAMIDAGEQQMGDGFEYLVPEIWRDMLAASLGVKVDAVRQGLPENTPNSVNTAAGVKASDDCPECGGTGEFESALHCEKCNVCGGTGKRPDGVAIPLEGKR